MRFAGRYRYGTTVHYEGPRLGALSASRQPMGRRVAVGFVATRVARTNGGLEMLAEFGMLCRYAANGGPDGAADVEQGSLALGVEETVPAREPGSAHDSTHVVS